jgi:ATP-dependent RNA helicase DDX19/DBP5
MTKEEEVDQASATSSGVKEEDKGNTNLIQNKHEVAVKLQDMQADPSSPLYSVKSFDELGL